jgi:maltose-binding protein MalE
MSFDDEIAEAKVHYAVVPPSEVLFCASRGLVDDGSDFAGHVRSVKMGFTDAAGVRWLRNPYGRLTELKPVLSIRADSARIAVLKQFADSFSATYGATVTFQSDPDNYPQKRLMEDMRMPDVADALVCPNDWIGALVREGSIDPVILSHEQRSAFPDWAFESLNYDGHLYGVPMTTDTVALIRNTALVPNVPLSLDELIAIGKDLRKGGRVTEVLAARIGENGDPFQIWPLFTSAGGWLFGRAPDGSWDLSSVGLASTGSIAAFKRLQELGETGQRILRRSMGGAEAEECFAEGRSAFLISTSDGLKCAREAGVPVAVSAVPPWSDAAKAKAFTLVHGLVIPTRGLNKTIVQELFADFLTRTHISLSLSKGVTSPTVLVTDEPQDSALRAYRRLCALGDPMPSFPTMRRVWQALGEALAAAVAGDDVETIARDAASAVVSAVEDWTSVSITS